MNKTNAAAPDPTPHHPPHTAPGQASGAQAGTDRQDAANAIRRQIDTLFTGGQPAGTAEFPEARPAAAPMPAEPRPAAAQPEPAATQTPAGPHTAQTPQAAQQPASPYHRTHSQHYDWQKYHTAWQSYYQQYYQRYYAQELQNAKLQIGQTATSAVQGAPAAQRLPAEHGAAGLANPANRAAQIKRDLLAKVGERAKKVRKSPHFVPALSGLLVVALFLFLQYNRVLVANVKAYVSPGSLVSENDTILVDPTAGQAVGPEPKLIIPKINLDVPVVYDEPSMQEEAIQKALERGVVRYNLPGANSLPGQAGNLVIGGHSSNDIFDPGSYKFAFVLIDRLQPGDIFYINYQSKRYVYRVTEKKIINPNEVSVLQIATSKPMSTLITCTPTGTALKRLLVIAEQISPDPSGATAQQPAQPANTGNREPAALPGNSPTLIERIQDWF